MAYGRGADSPIITASLTTTTGVLGAVALPNTAGNTVGTLLAYFAIAIGVAALTSQIVVRVLRWKYRTQS